MSSPTQRSLAALRKAGWTAEVVERWIPGANVRKDFLGFVDIICVSPKQRPLLVQTTSCGNVAARLKKIQASEHLQSVLPWFDIEVHGWGKSQKGRWELRTVKVVSCLV